MFGHVTANLTYAELKAWLCRQREITNIHDGGKKAQ